MDLNLQVQFRPEWGIVLLGALLCLVVLVSGLRSGNSLFTPLRLFLLANVGGLSIAYLRLDPRMTMWSMETWVVWLLAVSGYAVGSLFSKFAVPAPTKSPPRGPADIRVERGLLLLVSIPFFLAILGGVNAVGTLPVLAGDPEIARRHFVFFAPWAGWALGAAMLVFPLGARVLALGGPGVWKYHILFWVVVLLQLASGIRGPALFGFFCLASQWELGRGRIPLVRIAAGFSLFMALFILVAILRLGDAIHFTSKVPLSTILQVVASPPYVYIANCYWNLDFGIREILQGVGHPATWGFATSSGILDAIMVGGDIGKSLGFESVFNEKSAKVASLNTFSFVWPLYKDGGIPWATSFSLVWGFAASALHRIALLKKTSGWFMVSSFLTFASLFSFFALYFVVGSYLVFFALMILIAILLEKARVAKIAGPAAGGQGPEMAGSQVEA